MMHVELNIGKRFGSGQFKIDRLDKLSKRRNKFTGKPRSWNIHEEFAKYLASLITAEFKVAIEDQRFARMWPPLNMTYLRYKRVHRLSMKIWKATGLLEKSIIYKKRFGYYYVGVDPQRRYRNGPKVIEVAKCLEYGTSRMPARPLFRPIFEDIRKNVDYYWDQFLSLNNIDRDEVNATFGRQRFFRNRRTNLRESYFEEYVPTINNNPYQSQWADSFTNPTYTYSTGDRGIGPYRS